jgi:hypothetical protein
MFCLNISSDRLSPTNSILFNGYRVFFFLVQSCRGVQVTCFHPEPIAGKDWADVSILLYVIHEVVSDWKQGTLKLRFYRNHLCYV